MSTFDSRWLATMLARRQVLAGLGAVSAAALLPGCKGKKKPPPPPPAMPTMFDSARSLRDLVRASPDHLSARAAKLIAAKDYTGAVRFVRDTIAVVPPAYVSDAAIDGVRWGPDATLRAGAGTQRERAELLKAMLAAMGATARLLFADRPAGVDAAALYATRPPAFALDTSKLPALGSSVATAFAHVNDPFPDPDVGGVVSSLLALIPAGQAVAKNPYDGLDNRVPVVEYTVNGATKWAFALGTVDEVSATPAGLGSLVLPDPVYPKVQVRLLASMGDLPGVANPVGTVELVSGTWTADQLAGSRLILALPSASPQTTIGTPPDQVPLRIPTLSVVQPSVLEGGDAQVWSPSMGTKVPGAVGPPVTVFGAQFAAPAQMGGAAQGPYGAIHQLDSAAHAAALASVASLSAEVNAGAFPNLQLTVTALDGSGESVEGLTQADFAVTDEGAGESAVMISNAGATDLKVMLAYDCSGSVMWPMPGDKTAFDTALANAMVAAASPTPYLLGTVSLGSAPGPNGYVAPDATTIEGFVSSCVSFSPIWETLGQLAQQDGASLVVMVSDFQADDDAATIPAFQQRLAASGLAVAMIPVSTPDPNTIAAIQGLCPSVVLDPTSPTFAQQLTDFVTSFTGKAKSAGYRMAYGLPAAQQTNQTMRTAKVALAGRAAVSASAPYTVPAVGARGNAGIAGLYLEIGVGPAVSRRWLSGPRLDRFGNPVAAVSADFDATRAMVDGIITVAFEPGNPTDAASAEDALASFISFEPFVNAVNAGQTQQQALSAGSQIKLYGSALAQLVGPLPVASGELAVAPLGLRVAIATDVATATDGHTRRFDVVPDLNVSGAGSSDAGAAFAATLKHTAELSLREAGVSASSAAASLAGATLQYVAPSTAPTSLTGFSAADLAAWGPVLDYYGNWHRFVPTTPATQAMWIVEPNTGTAVAVRLDGTGGACGTDAVALWINGLGVYCSYAELQCNDMTGYACLGAIVASLTDTVVGDFVVAPIDLHDALDVMAFAFSLLSNIVIVGGLMLSLAASLYSAAAQIKYFADHCI